MARYPHQSTPAERAQRSGALIFGMVALVSVACAELVLQSLPELGPLIAAMYVTTILTSATVARSLAKYYLQSSSPSFGVSPVLAVPICSLGLGFLSPVLIVAVIGEIGLAYLFALTAMVALPAILVGGVLATILMHRWYGRVG